MNKNKVLLMYFTVFMCSLRAGPDHDLSNSDSDRSYSSDAESPRSRHILLKGHLKTLTVVNSAISELAKRQHNTPDESIAKLIQKLEYLYATQKYFEGEVAELLQPKPKKPKPIKNLKQCEKKYIELLKKLGKDDLEEKLPKYQNMFDRLVEFMNEELEGIKKTLQDRYSESLELNDDTLREKLFKIQEIYLTHLKVENILYPDRPGVDSYETRLKMPNTNLTGYDDRNKTKSSVYTFYGSLSDIETSDTSEVHKKELDLKETWTRYLLPLYPWITHNGQFELEFDQIIRNAGGKLEDKIVLTLFNWEMQWMATQISGLTDFKRKLQKEIQKFASLLSEMRSTKINPISVEAHDQQENEFKTQLNAYKQDAMNLVKRVFEQLDFNLWPSILELIILVSEGNLLVNLDVVEIMDSIKFFPIPICLNSTIDTQLRKKEYKWLQILVKKIPYTNDWAINDVDYLLGVEKAGYEINQEYIKRRIAWIIGMIQKAVNPKLNTFNLNYKDGHICGDANEILGLKS